MPKGKQGHDHAKLSKDYTPEEIATLQECFDLSFLQSKPITNVIILYRQLRFKVSGQIGQYHFLADNSAEYRTALQYDSRKPFYLKDFDFVAIRVWVEDSKGQAFEIYSR